MLHAYSADSTAAGRRLWSLSLQSSVLERPSVTSHLAHGGYGHKTQLIKMQFQSPILPTSIFKLPKFITKSWENKSQFSHHQTDLPFLWPSKFGTFLGHAAAEFCSSIGVGPVQQQVPNLGWLEWVSRRTFKMNPNVYTYTYMYYTCKLYLYICRCTYIVGVNINTYIYIYIYIYICVCLNVFDMYIYIYIYDA